MNKYQANDYYPLYQDVERILASLPEEARNSPEQSILLKTNPFVKSNDPIDTFESNNDYLLQLAEAAGLSPLEAMILFTKNTFEGHIELVTNLSRSHLYENGSRHLVAETGEYVDLMEEFCEAIQIYEIGLSYYWEKVAAVHMEKSNLNLRSILQLIVSWQLIRLPSHIAGSNQIDAEIQSHTFDPKDVLNYFLLQRIIARFVNRFWRFNDIQNNYYEQFKPILLKLEAKETLLNNLSVKLDLANSPTVETEKDLEDAFFRFIVASRSSDKNQQKLNPFLHEETFKNLEHKQLTEKEAKNLYRLIAKNCSEIHTQCIESAIHDTLNYYFIEANHLFNARPYHPFWSMVNAYRLADILISIVNFRSARGLKINNAITVNFKDTYMDVTSRHSNFEHIENELSQWIEYREWKYDCNFKQKHLSDTELAKLHVEHLTNQLKLYDEKVKQLLNQIDEVIHSKKKNAL